MFLVKPVWSLCKTDGFIPNIRYHWSIIPMEGYIEGVILLFTIIVVSSLSE